MHNKNDMKRGFGVSYAEMIQDDEGLFQQSEMECFSTDDDQDLEDAALFCSQEDVLSAWIEWIGTGLNSDVVELLRTERTRGWGRVFSVVPQDGREGRVYAVTVGG